MEAAKLTFPDGETFTEFLASIKELKATIEKNSIEADKRFREAEEEAKKRSIELDKRFKETDRIIGDLGNRFGELAEHLVAPGIADKFNDLGYHFDSVSPGGQVIKDENGKVIIEVDIILENCECIMAVEVKTKPRINDIEHHIKRLEILRKYRNKRNDSREILGAIAGAVFGDGEKKATIEAGFYVLEQSGDTMKVDIPQGFIPRKW